MKIQHKLFTAISFGLVASLAAVWPARAQSDVGEQIQALESQVQQLKSQQLELKKEATAAAAALPTFAYRPGSGLTISAADKSWSWNNNYRLDLNSYNYLDAKTNYRDSDDEQVNTGTERLKLTPRRLRWYHTFCWQDCFYQFNFTIDGEADDALAEWRDNEFMVNFNQLNPWLPYFSVGPRRGAGSTHLSRSSSSDGKMEHAAIISGFGWGGAGSHSGMGLGWEDVAIGPGTYQMYINWAMNQQGVYEEYNNSDRSGLMYNIGGKPFSKTKSKWLQGLEWEFGYQGQSMDRQNNSNPEQARPRLRNDWNRKVRFDYWRVPSSEVGDGWGHIFMPGVKWTVGPYFIRYLYVNTRYASNNSGNGASGVGGTAWTLDHQLNLWSPKGFFTGGPRRDNSIVVGGGFERTDVDCGGNCEALGGSTGTQVGRIHSNHMTNVHLFMWYWINRGLGVGMWWNHVITTNTPTLAQVATGCKDSDAEARAGKGSSRTCSHDDINVGLRFRW